MYIYAYIYRCIYIFIDTYTYQRYTTHRPLSHERVRKWIAVNVCDRIHEACACYV